MPLRITVISAHRESMGGGYVHEFSGGGGLIGRSLECDWPLPDAKRYVSSRHARIDYQAGCYYLIDTSHNGVYVNDAETPVGRGKPQRLFDGDRLRMGEFEMECTILEERTADQSRAMADSIVRAQQVPVDDLDEVALLEPEKLQASGSIESLLTPGDESGMVSAISPSPLLASRDDILNELAAGFLRDAGLDPGDFADAKPEALMRMAAQLLAVYTEGVRSLLQAKDASVAELGLNTGPSGDTNPLRTAPNSATALHSLLTDSAEDSRGTADAVAAIKELSRHQRGVLSAMRVALQDYLAYFAPNAVEQAFRGPAQAGTRFRELYARAYTGLARPGQSRLPERFDADFARAYQLETENEA